MRRWETLMALAGVACAVLGATRAPFHEWCTYGAIVLIGVVGISRLRVALTKPRPVNSDAAERARLIRQKRQRR